MKFVIVKNWWCEEINLKNKTPIRSSKVSPSTTHVHVYEVIKWKYYFFIVHAIDMKMT